MTPKRSPQTPLTGRVALVAGATRGAGRGIARALAEAGATVYCTGRSVTGKPSPYGRPETINETATLIKAAGGTAAANYDDITSWEGGQRLIEQAIGELGGLDILVNNAGILRDRMSFNMDEADWDAVINVHLKGHFVPSRFAGAYWRQKSKESGEPVNGTIINTSSEAGLFGNAGQLNYGGAKAGIAAMTIILARELDRFGVRSNAIAPAARTRLTLATPGLGEVIKEPTDASKFDIWDPANISPLIGYLATEDCPVTGKIFFVQGGKVQLMQPFTLTESIDKDDRWTVGELQSEMKRLIG